MIVRSNVNAVARVFTVVLDKIVSSRYNADGLIALLGRVTETEYILHGKLVTEMIVRKYGEATPAQITEENRLQTFLVSIVTSHLPFQIQIRRQTQKRFCLRNTITFLGTGFISAP